MKSVQCPMHLPGGSLLSISDVLAAFPENRYVWVIFEFFGVGRAPMGMGMPEFEDRVRSAPKGLQMTWADLEAFGVGVTQAFECEIVAFRAADYYGVQCNVDLAVAKICALDSTEWCVSVDETAEEFRSVLNAVRRIAAETK
ncbi:hypothetical protein AB0J68_18120 [Micromonospora sp. NPDC049580]|uniref:hypothetical protein n=1 Tax=unclassified Micromonospora TaxID=2617518 RepID=UPI003447443C